MRNFVEEFKKKEIPLNMLFNNAGEWMREDNTYTQEGFQASREILCCADIRRLCAGLCCHTYMLIIVMYGADYGRGAALFTFLPDYAADGQAEGQCTSSHHLYQQCI